MQSESVQPSHESTMKDERLARILAECSDRLNANEPVDVDRLVSENPDLSPDLKIALESMRTVDASIGAERPLGVLGDFRLLRELGRGGMGIVYEAWQASLDRRVALKVLPPSLVANKKAVARFELEAKTAGRLRHPGIVAVYGKGIEDGAPYFAMEHVEGETLDKLLENVPSGHAAGSSEFDRSSSLVSRVLRSSFSAFHVLDRQGKTTPLHGAVEPDVFPKAPPPDPPRVDPGLQSGLLAEEVHLKHCLRAAEAFAEVADALQYAHGRGVIHRDIKPSNLILDRGKGEEGCLPGRLRILDFGLARIEGEQSLTMSGEFLGTPVYMSPEQAMAKRVPVDHRTDVYSFGATLYEVLTRRAPFRGRNYKETLSQVISRDPPPLRRYNSRIPRNLETIVLKCLRKDPRDRYGTAEAVAQDLRRFVKGDPIEARPQPFIEKIARRAWRHRLRVGAVVSVLLLCVTSGLLALRWIDEHRARLEIDYADHVTAAIVLAAEGLPVIRSVGSPEGAPRQSGDARVAFAVSTGRNAEGDASIDGAIARLDEAIQIFPRRPVARYHKARALSLLGRGKEALAELELAIQSDPDFVPAVALWRALSEEPEGAREIPLVGTAGWRQAWIDAHRSLARVPRDLNGATKAFSALLDARDADNFLGSRLEALLGRGRAFLEAGDSIRAVEDFAAARWAWRDLVEPGLLLGKAHTLRGAPDRAKQVFEEMYEGAVRDLVRGPEVALRVASIYLTFGEPEEAMRWALRAPRSSEREQLRANILAEDPDSLSEALEAASWASQATPDDPRARETIGYVLYRQDRKSLAEDEFREAVRLDPEMAQAHKDLGYIYYEQEKFEESARHYEAAVRLRPHDARARSNLGESLRQLGRLDESIVSHTMAVALEPDQASFHHNRALALEDHGDVDEALSSYGQAASLESGAGRFSRCLQQAIRVAKLQGDFAEAVTWYDRALVEKPDSLTAHYNRLVALFELLRDEQRETVEVLPKAKEALGVFEEAQARSIEKAAFRACYVDVLLRLAGLAEEAEGRQYAERGVRLLAERVDRPEATASEWNQYAWALLGADGSVGSRDPAKALEYAKRAAAGSEEKDPEILDTLALAYFENGDAERACAIQEKAMALLSVEGEDLKARYGTPRLERMRRDMERQRDRFREKLSNSEGGRVGASS